MVNGGQIKAFMVNRPSESDEILPKCSGVCVCVCVCVCVIPERKPVPGLY